MSRTAWIGAIAAALALFLLLRWLTWEAEQPSQYGTDSEVSGWPMARMSWRGVLGA